MIFIFPNMLRGKLSRRLKRGSAPTLPGFPLVNPVATDTGQTQGDPNGSL